jgi:hypothetical protein
MVVMNIDEPAETQSEIPSRIRIEKWAAIEGRWELTADKAKYLGPSKPGSANPLGLAIGSVPFRDGSFRTTIRITRNQDTSAGIVLGYQSMNAEWAAVQLGAYNCAYAISLYRPTIGWTGIATAGLLSNLKVNEAHVLEVTVAGQRVTMHVNEVRVLEIVLPKPLEGTGAGLFAWDNAELLFSDPEVVTVRPRIFVIMPFAEPYDTLYRDVIRPVAQKLDFQIVRVDEIKGPGIIIQDIQRQISQANAVVAEISSGNPNVFYELGYAHALDKPAVLLARKETMPQTPFDVRAYRAIPYDDTIGGKKTVERNLEQHLRAVLGNGALHAEHFSN